MSDPVIRCLELVPVKPSWQHSATAADKIKIPVLVDIDQSGQPVIACAVAGWQIAVHEMVIKFQFGTEGRTNRGENQGERQTSNFHERSVATPRTSVKGE